MHVRRLQIGRDADAQKDKGRWPPRLSSGGLVDRWVMMPWCIVKVLDVVSECNGALTRKPKPPGLLNDNDCDPALEAKHSASDTGGWSREPTCKCTFYKRLIINGTALPDERVCVHVCTCALNPQWLHFTPLFEEALLWIYNTFIKHWHQILLG